jgi:hypothetical protein
LTPHYFEVIFVEGDHGLGDAVGIHEFHFIPDLAHGSGFAVDAAG